MGVLHILWPLPCPLSHYSKHCLQNSNISITWGFQKYKISVPNLICRVRICILTRSLGDCIHIKIGEALSCSNTAQDWLPAWALPGLCSFQFISTTECTVTLPTFVLAQRETSFVPHLFYFPLHLWRDINNVIWKENLVICFRVEFCSEDIYRIRQLMFHMSSGVASDVFVANKRPSLGV